MRINHLSTISNSPIDKTQELTIYHYLNNNNTNNKHFNNSISTKNETTKDYNMNDLSDNDYILELHKKLEQKREIQKINEILNCRIRL